MKVCHFCGHILDQPLRVYRSSLCPGCSQELKICYNCRFYSPGAHWDCAESIREPVRDKDRSNFCDFFQFRESSEASDENSRPASGGQKAFDKLFGDES
jgi:hypothetical protein